MVHYQPIVCLKTNLINGFEALVRWEHPELGLISPAEFIPLAEETGLITLIDPWVLRQACRQLKLWQEQFPAILPLSVSVNLSGKQFSQPNLIEEIDQILRETGLKGESLKLEMTESILIENAESAAIMLKELKERDIQIYIDDFGTGYSFLSYLYRFPVDKLKIDRSFVTPIDTQGKNSEIVKTIITLTHSLAIKAITEGVETSEQLLQLKKLGYNEAQGYFFSKPVNSKLAEALLPK